MEVVHKANCLGLKAKRKHNPTVAGDQNWTPPSAGQIKINVGEALFPERKRSGIGVVCRDERGRLVCGCVDEGTPHLDVEMVEAVGVLKGLEVARAKGFTFTNIIASDCLSVINHIRSQTYFLNHLGGVLDDIEELAAKVTSCAFYFVDRGTNVLAHSIIRQLFNSDVKEWNGVPL